MNSKKNMINFEELIMYFVKKWKVVAAIMIICITVITSTVWIFFEKKFVETDFLYTHYEKLVQEEEEYQNNSPIMKMDYNEVHKKNIFIENIEDIEDLKQYVLSEKIWDEFATDTPKKFLSELISWDEPTEEAILLSVRYDTEEKLNYVDYLVEQLKKFDDEIQIDVSEEYIEYDSTIQSKQHQRITLFRHYTEQMKISRVGYVQETAVTSAIVFSFVLGAILSVAVVFTQLINSKQFSKEEKN